ncbi:MAG: pyrroline-5-carboxylate reductase family protein, partial [Thomasclavelia spiroformis]
MKKIGFIGMGNMASAIAGGIIKSGFIDGKNVYAFDIDSDKLAKMNLEFGIIGCKSEIDLVETVDIIVMAVKPNIVEDVILKVK